MAAEPDPLDNKPSYSSSEIVGDPLAALPWATRAATSVLVKIRNAACHRDGTVNRHLLDTLDVKASPKANPIDSVGTSDFTIPIRSLSFRLFSPATTDPIPVIIYFHGGGFSTMSPASQVYDTLCRRLAREAKAFVVSAGDGLSPEHKYPSQHKYLFDNAATVLPGNADMSRFFIAGDSAGGNIAHHTAVRLAQSNIEHAKARGLIAIQPFFGGKELTESDLRNANAPILSLERTDWLWKAFLPEGSDRDHPACNVSGPNAIDISTVKEFPSVILFIGGIDPLHDWQIKYYEWLNGSGKDVELVEFPNMVHAFYAFKELRETAELFSKIKEFVMKRPSKQM